MKINEVELIAGITKKNIRFYEEQGLLNPGRNKENGYRDYNEDDIEELNKVKLLRKLSIPIEEIRKIQKGELTLDDALKRQDIVLEREQRNIEEISRLCKELASSKRQYQNLHPTEYLQKMEEMEKEGMRFMNIKKNDKTTQKVVPIIIGVAFSTLMICILIPIVLVLLREKAPIMIPIILVIVFISTVVGIIIAMIQRVKAIEGGEEDAASKY